MSFIVYGLPRSRTFWLSRFLSYGDWECGHDELRHCRSMDDVRSWFAQPGIGTVETAASQWWRMLPGGVRTFTIRRPVDDVVESLNGLGLNGSASAKHLRALDQKLNQIERRVPGVVSFKFSDLETEDGCAYLFERCLPYRHDHEWWKTMAALNLQVNMRSIIKYTAAHWPQLSGFAKQMAGVHRYNLRAAQRAEQQDDGITIQTETFDSYWNEAQPLIREHCQAIGKDPDNIHNMNTMLWGKMEDADGCAIITARLNGRMVGYVTALLGSSMDDARGRYLTQLSFFLTEDVKGMRLAQRMQRSIVDHAKWRGAQKMYMRAGVLANGPKFGVLYKRMGAKPFGELYELDLV